MNKTEHLLTIAAEECAEIAHRISKALRFGLDEQQEGQEYTNAERISHEVCDLMVTLDMLYSRMIISPVAFEREKRVEKRKAIKKYMAYAKKCGTLYD